MLGRLSLALLLLAPALAGCIQPAPLEAATAVTPPPVVLPHDAVVVAVVDYGINPYHLDWSLSTMPQNLDDDAANDVALELTDDAWRAAFAAGDTAVHALNLTLSTEPGTKVEKLRERDETAIKGIKQSSADDVHAYYVPGTKIVGLVDFAGDGAVSGSGAHGARAASVAAGNVYGSCPECLLVFVNNGGGEDAFEWAISQPWIDVVTNSYGYSLLIRDRLYSGSDIALSREASERGQTIFFSAGNGQANTFTAPNPTLFSSQEGPDWMVTVGAVGPSSRASYTGHGKPADIASIGSRYPSQGGDEVDGEGTFGGTSSATPTVAGTYARALWWARHELGPDSRVQEEGVVARGEPVACGEARPDCELGDGILTAKELRTRLFHGALHTPDGFTVQDVVTAPPVGEEEFLNEGHGSYFGRMDGDDAWNAELERIVGPMVGASAPLERPEGELEWMVVDSWCRQHLWAPWDDGYYVDGETALPGADTRWPLRTALLEACPSLFPPV